jgi:hypothetical protein
VVSPAAGLKIRPKKKIVVDLLCLCVEHSKLVTVLAVDTVRYVVESALGEIYREGEFRLDPLWAILLKEPGLTPDMSAAPLLAFKSLEESTGLRIRLPADVIGLAPLKANELRREVQLPSNRLNPLIEELKAADANSVVDLEARMANTGRYGQPRTTGTREVVKPTSDKGKTQVPAFSRILGLVAISVGIVAIIAYFMFLR